MADDKVIKSENTTHGNFFDGGNGRNIGLENDKYDLEKDLLEYSIKLNEKGGNLTAEEAAKQREEGLKALAENHESAIKGIKLQSAINVGLNVTGLVLSAGSGASAAMAKTVVLKGAQGATKILAETGKQAGKQVGKEVAKEVGEQAGKQVGKEIAKEAGEQVGKQAAKEAAKEAGEQVGKQIGKEYILKGTSLTFKETTKGLKVSLLGTVKNMAKEATVGSFKGAKGILGVLGGVGKSAKTIVIGSTNILGALGAKCMTGGGVGKGVLTKLATSFAKGAIGMGAISAPLITTQIITRNISNKKTAELNDAIAVLSDGNMYYNDCYNSLTADQQEQYERLQTERDNACAELLEDYAGYMDEEGNFTDQTKAQEFYEKYKLIEEAAAADLAEQTQAWSGYADYVTHEGIGNKFAESTIDNEVDVDQFRKTSLYGDWVFSDERNADALETAKQAQELREDLNDDGFLGFIDKVHDTLIHYVPVLSYVEAGLKIGTDRLMEGVSGLFKFNYDEKYEGVGIGDLAASISADAEADNEKREQLAGLEQSAHDGAITDVTQYKQRAADGSLTAESNGSSSSNNQTDFEADPDPV